MTSYLEAIGMPDRYRLMKVPCALCGGQEFTRVQSEGRIAEPGIYGELPIEGCNRCGFLMINPRYEAQFYRDYYLQVYRRVATGESLPTSEYLQRQTRRAGKILKFLGRFKIQPGKMLDIGCSSGATMIPFREAGWETVGVDPDRGCVEYGQQLGLPVQLGDAENIPFPPATFDLVQNLGTFEHVYDLQKAFQGCRKVLKEDGLLFLQYRSSTMWGSPLEYFNHNHYCYFSENTVRIALMAFGFEPLEFTQQPIEGMPGMHYVVARPAEPATQEQLLRVINGGLRDDIGQVCVRLKEYEERFQERARQYLALVERSEGDPVAVARAIHAGEVDYRILDGPIPESVQRGILEAQRFLQYREEPNKISGWGMPVFKNLRYCQRCCMPETSEGTVFDEMGICRACQSSEQKMHINWVERETELRKLLEQYKSRSGSNYDCLVPISGGKDSAFQLHVLIRQYGMKPLACTFSHNWFTETGQYNLWNILEKLNVDHIQFTPNQALVARIARQSLTAIGDPCWHCHAGVGAFPLQIAVKMGIPLIVWGESVAEAGNKASYDDHVQFDETYYKNVSMKVAVQGMVSTQLSGRDLHPFEFPTSEELRALGFRGLFLGDYLFWDGERQVEFLKKEYGWKEDNVEGTYKGYKSVECRMSGVHDYAKFIKRGFGRATDHASQDVRAGLLTREEAFELIKQYDPKRPQELDYYLRITGWTEEEFKQILHSQRSGKALELPTV